MNQERIETARLVAILAHGNQTRKHTGEPFWHHCDRVAKMVKDFGLSEDAVITAYLHDTVEDTQVTLTQIRSAFGENVAIMVDSLTHVMPPVSNGMNRFARKQYDRNKLSGACSEAQSIKLADIIDNLPSIVRHDPDFARVYVKEKELMLKTLDNGHSGLTYEAGIQYILPSTL